MKIATKRKGALLRVCEATLRPKLKIDPYEKRVILGMMSVRLAPGAIMNYLFGLLSFGLIFLMFVHIIKRHLMPSKRGASAFSVAPQVPWGVLWTVFFGAALSSVLGQLAGWLLPYNPSLLNFLLAFAFMAAFCLWIAATRSYTARLPNCNFDFKRDSMTQVSLHECPTKAGALLPPQVKAFEVLKSLAAVLPDRSGLPKAVHTLVFDTPQFGGGIRRQARSRLERAVQSKYPGAQIIPIDRTWSRFSTWWTLRFSRNAESWRKTSLNADGLLQSGGFKVLLPRGDD